ncbi:MFS transporter [Candidatus Dactylopiibacterium carminicum]|uniref:MFS transporter n=1 Tax=Candidatus Dactylopiibacterium carminicum TaxID=857335 RepID=UPI001CC31F90|nr:MFS transporter [Candidatus Dactylopiibacterium carminicum]
MSVDRRSATALLVAATFFMENLGATVIATSLPTMARDFGALPAHLSVGVSAYLVALTVFIPVSGWAADRFGARRVFATAIVLFTLASLLCALSESVSGFTLARTLQGIGGAMMVPVGRLVVLRDTPKEGIVRAIAILTWPALVAPILGPPLGGWISTYWSWHWIFLLNLPLGIVALMGTFVLVRNEGSPVGRFDATGFLLTGLGFTLFMVGIELASRTDLSAWAWSLSLMAGVLLLGLSSIHLRRSERPLFALSPLRIATFRVTAVGGSMFRTAIGTAPFLLPLMFQLGFG